MEKQTLCIHGNDLGRDVTGAVSTPIYQSATFVHPGVGNSTGYDYSRTQNPTREQLEKRIASLEHGVDAIAFATGMAAASALMELFQPGDHLIASDDLYGGSLRLFQHISNKNGIEVTLVNTGDIEAIRASIKENTKALFIETPSNPLMQVTDIQAASQVAKSKGLLVIADNTFLTPYFQQPLRLGADIVLHSGTKYLGGHNDTLAGILVVKDWALSEKLRFIYKTLGNCLSPFDSWLILRGIKTLAIRMQAQQDNAMKLAPWLKAQKVIKKVHYVGLPEHPGYKISCTQASGFGAMISFEVEQESVAVQILERVSLIQYAESLGGVESLITYPMLQTHADVPKEQRDAKGVNEYLLRLSVGLEHIDDIISDLKQALHD